MTLPPAVTYIFEGSVIVIALGIALRASWKGNPRPSAFLTALFLFAAIGSSMGNKAKAEMMLAWGLAALSLLSALFVKNPAVSGAGIRAPATAKESVE